jgi:hypothetical protein
VGSNPATRRRRGAARPTERAQTVPGFYELYGRTRYTWMYPEVAMDEVAASAPTNLADRYQLSRPVTYVGYGAVQHDIATLRASLAGLDVSDAFISAVTPVSRKATVAFSNSMLARTTTCTQSPTPCTQSTERLRTLASSCSWTMRC